MTSEKTYFTVAIGFKDEKEASDFFDNMELAMVDFTILNSNKKIIRTKL